MPPEVLSPLQVLRRFEPHDFSLVAFFQARLQAQPHQVLLEFEDQRLTWAECSSRADQAAAWLRQRGLQAGDRIGLMAFNHPATVVLLLACARLGLILVPCNPEFEAHEARYIFAHAQVKGVVCSIEAADTVTHALDRLDESGHPAPWQVAIEHPWNAEAPLLEQWAACRGEAAATSEAAQESNRADQTLFILYTSGTTGFPKGVMHSQRSYVLTAEAFVQRMHLQPDERLMCVLPLFHINALMYSLGGAMACGGTLILVRRFSASAFWRTAARTQATEVNVIMSAAAILARRPAEEFDASHCLRKMFIAPLSAHLKDAFEQRFGVPVLIECYGMTEIPGLLANPYKGPRKLGSMGTISAHPDPAIQQPQVRLVDEADEEVPVGQVGELLARTPTIMQGYWRDPEQTAAAFRDGWFATGDLAWRDEDGFHFFHARQKDIIRRRGENISGAEIDTAVASHPGVLECATIGVPAELGEEEILCAVVVKPGATLTPHQVHAHACDRLSPLKHPRYVVLVDSLPHTGSLKIAKFRLKPADDLVRRATDFHKETTR